MSEALLEVKSLKKYFPVKQGLLGRTVGHVKAVDDISITLQPGETFGLVGESGSGKSTVGRTVLRLTDKTDGEVKFKGVDIHSLSAADMRLIRPQMQLIFQDPYSALNPRVRVGDAIGEALLDHGLCTRGRCGIWCWRPWRPAAYLLIISTASRMNSPADSASGSALPGR